MDKYQIHKEIYQIHENFVTSNDEVQYYSNTIKFFKKYLPYYLKDKFHGGMIMISNATVDLGETNNGNFEVYNTAIGKMIFSESWFGDNIPVKQRFLYTDRLMKIGPRLQELKKTISLTNSTLLNKWDTTVFFDSGISGELLKKDFNKLPYQLNYFDLKNFLETEIMMDLCSNFESGKVDGYLEKEISEYSYPMNNDLSKFIETLPPQIDLSPLKQYKGIIDLYKSYLKVSYTEFGEKLLIYNVRPKILHNHFNGIIFLVVNSELTLDEYIDIEDISIRIFSETIKIITEKLAKDAEWKTIVEKMSHSTRHQFKALQDRIDEIYNNAKTMSDVKDMMLCNITNKVSHILKQNEYVEECKELINYVDKIKFNLNNSFENRYFNDLNVDIEEAKRYIGDLADTNEFIFALVKFNEGKDKLDKRLQEILKPERFSLHQTILNSLKTIYDSVDLLGLLPNHKEKVKNCITNLNISLNFSNIDIIAAERGFRVVILDLLKNAFVYTDIENPIVNIDFIDSDDRDYFELNFSNNTKMKQAAIDFINHGRDSESWNKDRCIGWSTIKMILNFSEFGDSGEKWGAKAEISASLINTTIIKLQIPKKDIIYGRKTN